MSLIISAFSKDMARSRHRIRGHVEQLSRLEADMGTKTAATPALLPSQRSSVTRYLLKIHVVENVPYVSNE